MRALDLSWIDTARTHHRSSDGSKPSIDEADTALISMRAGLNTGSVSLDLSHESTSLLDILDKKLLPPSMHIHWDNLVQETTKGRRHIMTEKGSMGLAPWYVRPRFKIAVLLGCSVPVLLEWHEKEVEDEDEPNGWYFRCDCFVQGWMFGEKMSDFGATDEEVWEELSTREKIRIH